jgi:multidrug resistance efflux pump
MKKRKFGVLLIISLIMFLLITGCDAIMENSEDGLSATGSVEAIEVAVSSEVAGTISEIYFREGKSVSQGEELLKLKNDVLEAEYSQALVGYEAAKASLEAAKAALSAAKSNVNIVEISLSLAEIQLEMASKAANYAERPLREESWNGDLPSEFDLPSWYFSRGEEIAAMEVEVEEAYRNLDIEEENLEDILDNISNADFIATEKRLVNAQAAFLVAEELLDRQIESNGREAIDDYVQDIYDSAEAELESAQAEYDSLLSTEKAENVLEGRARVEVARERVLTALAMTYDLQIGEDSLEVTAAELAVAQAENLVEQANAAVVQAESGVTVAENSVNQAKAALDLLETQMAKLIVTSPVDGIVLAKTFEEGELVSPGTSMLVVGKLDALTITVYLPEDVYGQVSLGDMTEVTVNSYPGEIFEAEVIRIADKAEYTPRNVQTEEDRRTTVFAIELSVIDSDGKLKPGMPVDVIFSE